MPDIFIQVPEGAFDAEARGRMARAAVAVMTLVDRDAKGREPTTWAVVDEIKVGHGRIDGHDPVAQTIPVLVHVYHLAGRLDAVARVEMADLFQDICSEARRAGERRQVAASVMVAEVAEGWWGVDGQVLRLSAESGYGHSRPMVST